MGVLDVSSVKQFRYTMYESRTRGAFLFAVFCRPYFLCSILFEVVENAIIVRIVDVLKDFV